MIPIEFKRKHFIRDLLKLSNIIQENSLVEFQSFQDFADVCIKRRLLDMQKVAKIIVPVTNAAEVTLLCKISDKARAFLFFYLKDFSDSTLEAFSVINNCAILCDRQDVFHLRDSLLRKPFINFCKLCSKSYGVFRDTVTVENFHDLPFIYGEAFKSFPFFCTPWIEWNYESFKDFPLRRLEELFFYLRFVYLNFANSSQDVDWSKYCSGIKANKAYKYSFLKKKSLHSYYIANNKIYLDRSKRFELDIDFISNSDANNIPLADLDQYLSIYKAKSSVRGQSIDSTVYPSYDFLTADQNIRCTGNPVMYPPIALEVSRILTTGNP